MAGPNDLAPIADALAWLGLLSDDSVGTVQRLITAASTSIQKYLGYNIAVTSYTETHNGIGSHRQLLRNRPIQSIASVNLIVGAAGILNIPARITGQAGYSYDDRAVYLDPPYRFEKGLQNIQIAYSAGYPSIPLDLEQACLAWLQPLYLQSAIGGGIAANVSDAKAGDHELKFAYLVTQLKTGTTPIPPSILMQLQPYIRVYPV